MKLSGSRQCYKTVLRVAIPIMVQNGITNALCLLFGVAAALLLDRFNRKVDVPDSAA